MIFEENSIVLNLSKLLRMLGKIGRIHNDPHGPY